VGLGGLALQGLTIEGNEIQPLFVDVAGAGAYTLCGRGQTMVY